MMVTTGGACLCPRLSVYDHRSVMHFVRATINEVFTVSGLYFVYTSRGANPGVN